MITFYPDFRPAFRAKCGTDWQFLIDQNPSGRFACVSRLTQQHVFSNVIDTVACRMSEEALCPLRNLCAGA